MELQAGSNEALYQIMLARYYSSSLGRFMAVDSGGDSHPEEPQSWNKYSYVRNNPLKAIDPDGKVTMISPWKPLPPVPALEAAKNVLNTAASSPSLPSVVKIAAHVLAGAIDTAWPTTPKAVANSIATGAVGMVAPVAGVEGKSLTQVAKETKIDTSTLTMETVHERPSTEGGVSQVNKFTNPKTEQTDLVVHQVTDADGKVLHRDIKAVRDSTGTLHKEK